MTLLRMLQVLEGADVSKVIPSTPENLQFPNSPTGSVRPDPAGRGIREISCNAATGGSLLRSAIAVR